MLKVARAESCNVTVPLSHSIPIQCRYWTSTTIFPLVVNIQVCAGFERRNLAPVRMAEDGRLDRDEFHHQGPHSRSQCKASGSRACCHLQKTHRCRHHGRLHRTCVRSALTHCALAGDVTYVSYGESETNKHVYELLEYSRSNAARLSFLRSRYVRLAQGPCDLYQPSS